MSRWSRVFAPTAGLTALILVGSGIPASAQGSGSGSEENLAPTPAVERAFEVASGASDDAAAVMAAATDFDGDDPSSIAALADAASASTAIALEGSGSDAGVDAGIDGVATVDVSGASASISDGSGLQLGISASGDGADTSLVGGVNVTQDVINGMDVVTRAVPNGVQIVAVLADENADTSIDFALDLPDGAVLDAQSDGSLNVVVPTETQAEDPVDVDRWSEEAATIIGSTDNLDLITDEQWAQLEALEPVSTSTEVIDTRVGTIGAPWATDANGALLETSYKIDGNILTQHVATTDRTAFPVVADPSLAFWKTAAMCTGQLVLLTAGALKLVQMAGKFVKFVSGLKATSKVAKAWKKLKGSSSNVKAFGKLSSSLYTLIRELVKGGASAMKKKMTGNATLTAAGTMLTYAGGTLASIIGIDHCVNLARGKY